MERCLDQSKTPTEYVPANIQAVFSVVSRVGKYEYKSSWDCLASELCWKFLLGSYLLRSQVQRRSGGTAAGRLVS